MSEEPPKYAGKIISANIGDILEDERTIISFEMPIPQTDEQYRSCSTESEKCLELYLPFTLKDGIPVVGIDLASGGKPCVPWAINFDLPADEFRHYNSGAEPRQPLHVRGHADDKLPFESNSFEWCFSSHFLEDRPFEVWPRIIYEWARIVKPGGHVIILTPDKERWNYAVQVLGQPCNCAHVHEPAVGDMSIAAKQAGLEVVMDQLTELYEFDYGLLGVFRKP